MVVEEACVAIDEDTSVQEANYEKVRMLLEKDGQVLEWPVKPKTKE